MKKINTIYILIVIIILLLTFLNVINIFKGADLESVMALSSIISTEDYLLQKHSEKYKKCDINIYYPVTKYEVLNKYVMDFIKDITSSFKENCNDEYEYTLFANFDFVKYKDYLTFIFHTSEDLRGAHPIPNLYTITYNIKDNNIVNIDSLIKTNNNILNILSKESYNLLNENKKIKEIGLDDLVKDGTKPTKDNFRNIAFTKDGLKVLFMQYQVAPYAYGEFSATIPYNKLNLKIN